MSEVVRVNNARVCEGCDNCVDIYYGAKYPEDICRLYIKDALARIAGLLRLLGDDHKHGDHSYDSWTERTVDLLNLYISYLEECLRNHEMPMSFGEWLVAEGLVSGSPEIRKPDWADMHSIREGIRYSSNERRVFISNF